MQIHLRNEIQLDDQVEVLVHAYEGEVREKNGLLYLLYQNEDKEKVVIKCGADELLMTRFSTPNSVMRFAPNAEAVVQVQTPMGMQHFVTQTSRYELNITQQEILLQYHLKPLEGEQIFASYAMKISWK